MDIVFIVFAPPVVMLETELAADIRPPPVIVPAEVPAVAPRSEFDEVLAAAPAEPDESTRLRTVLSLVPAPTPTPRARFADAKRPGC